MATKRDRVNRVKGLVYLPIDGSRLVKGDRVTLTHVQEADIFPDVVKDPMEMKEPVNGNAVGDAIFDAIKDPTSIFRVIGDDVSDVENPIALGFEDGNFNIFLDTGASSYEDNYLVCDPMEGET
ncbi:MAG: hypothetical protein IKT27_01830 [Clostridia bacterium]|nr:hypothetical protein [Clostridia bacterium]